MVEKLPDYMKPNSKFISTTVNVEKSSNTLGSTAGAGSGDFHQYRQLRRKERYRLVQMEATARRERAVEEHNQVRQDLLRETENKTLSKNIKRRMKKEKKKLYKKMGGPPPKPIIDPSLVEGLPEKRPKPDVVVVS